MAAARTALVIGPDAARVAHELARAIQDRRDAWPYVHEYAPPNAKDVHVIGTLETQLPATGALEVVKYQVSSGKRFYLRAVLLSANVAVLPGAALFTVDRNSPVDVTNLQYMPEHGLVNVPVSLGSIANVPWLLQRAREFAPLNTVRIKATNVTLAVGTPNFWVCGLFGYEVPVLGT